MAKVLVAGGAGYVGGTCAAWLKDDGHDVWVLDDLSRGHREFIDPTRFLHARVGDTDKVLPFLKKQQFDCVMHFAAFALVEESVREPQKYFENNVRQTELLLDSMIQAGTHNFI